MFEHVQQTLEQAGFPGVRTAVVRVTEDVPLPSYQGADRTLSIPPFADGPEAMRARTAQDERVAWLEREAARRYEELAAAMGTEGQAELRSFFARMAHYSRLHLAEAQARGGFRTLPRMGPEDYEWPDGIAPETADVP